MSHFRLFVQSLVGRWQRGNGRRERSTSTLRAFQHRSFTVLWTGLFLYRSGFWIGLLTFQTMVAGLTDNSPLMLGLLAFFNSLPMLVVSPFGGVIADRLDRKMLIVINQAAMGVAAAIISYLVISGRAESVAVIFALATVLGIGLAFAIPLNQAAVANSVPPKDLRSAVSINSIGLNLARIGGPALAGPILALWGPGGSFSLWALVTLLGALAISRITLRPYTPDPDTLGVFGRIRDGITYATGRPALIRAMAATAVVTVFGTSYMAALPVVSYGTLGGNDSTFTTLIMLVGFGAMVGAFFAGSGRLPLDMTTIIWGAIIFAVAEAMLGMARSFWMAALLVPIVGGFNFFTFTCLTTLVQTLVIESKRGRVMSLLVLAWGGLFPVGSLTIGALGEWLGTSFALIAFGAALGAYGLWALSSESRRP